MRSLAALGAALLVYVLQFVIVSGPPDEAPRVPIVDAAERHLPSSLVVVFIDNMAAEKNCGVLADTWLWPLITRGMKLGNAIPLACMKDFVSPGENCEG